MIRITFDIPTDDDTYVVALWLSKTIRESPVPCPYHLFTSRLRVSKVDPLSEYESRGLI